MSDEPDSPDMVAAEYVMGLLDGDEMVAVRRRALNDRGLADAIGAWERRLAPLADTVAPVVPPSALWLRIDGEIAAMSRGAANGAGADERDGPVADARAGSNVEPMPPRPSAVVRVWRSAALWRATTVASLALAAAFAAIAYLPHQAQPMVSIAAIGPMGAPPPAFLAQAAPDGRVSVAAVSPGAVPNGRDLELWLLPPGAQRPTSLGVLPSGGKSLLLSAVPPDGSQLLVSLEPQGGSPTGQPTGAVLYGGKLAQPSGT